MAALLGRLREQALFVGFVSRFEDLGDLAGLDGLLFQAEIRKFYRLGIVLLQAQKFLQGPHIRGPGRNRLEMHLSLRQYQ